MGVVLHPWFVKKKLFIISSWGGGGGKKSLNKSHVCITFSRTWISSLNVVNVSREYSHPLDSCPRIKLHMSCTFFISLFCIPFVENKKRTFMHWGTLSFPELSFFYDFAHFWIFTKFCIVIATFRKILFWKKCIIRR